MGWLACATPAWSQAVDVLFDDTRLHTLELTVHSRDWEDLKTGYQSNTYYPADLTWNGVVVRSVGMRSRGNGSRSGEKPGLELEFNYYVKGQEFLGLRSLVLDNLRTDTSMMREVVAMALLRRVGVPASRESFARLVVNGEYAGLYAMVEAVDREFARRHIGASGFLFEYRYSGPFYGSYLGDELETYQRLFASRNGSSGSMDTLYGPIRELFRAINETSNDEFMSVDRNLDFASFLRLIAADGFMAEYDGIFGYDGMNNVYLYQVGERSYFIPWDKDHAFWNLEAPAAADTNHVLMARVLNTPQLRQLYLDAVKEVAAAAALDNWLDVTIARYYELVRESALGDSRKPWDNEVFEAAIDDLRAFARSRVGFAQADAVRLRPH